MAKRKTLLDELHEEIAANPAMNAAFQRELARLELANQIMEARTRAKLSQAQLAKRIGTHQPAVARMERGDYNGHNVGTLAKIAVATGTHVEIRFTRPTGRAARAR